MNLGSNDNNSKQADGLPKWEDCDCFCIHDYAGTGRQPCGWRGRLNGVRHNESEPGLRCPRCGCATLLRIPLARIG